MIIWLNPSSLNSWMFLRDVHCVYAIQCILQIKPPPYSENTPCLFWCKMWKLWKKYIFLDF